MHHAHPERERHILADTGTVTDVHLTNQPLHTTLQVTLITAGVANGLQFAPDVLRAATNLFENVPVFLDHAAGVDLTRPGGRSVRDLAGIIERPTWSDTDQAITATLKLSTTHDWITDLINEFAPYPSLFGLSADLWLRRQDGSKRPSPVLAIDSVNSVDIVIRPAAGGRFVTTPTPDPTTEPNTMSQPTTPDTTAERAQLATTERAQTAAADPNNPPQQTANDAPTVPLETAITLALDAADLPTELRNLLSTQHYDTLDEARSAIDNVRAAWANATAHATVRNLGQPLHMRDPRDRIELAAERLFGVGDTADHRAAPRLTGIRELYDTLTGDWDRTGMFYPDRATFAAATTSTMAEVTRNVLNKVLLKAYESRPKWWQPIATEVDLPNLTPPRWIGLGGIVDLSTVTEGNAYTELTWDDTSETSAWVKAGNYIGITLEMIDRDDVQAIAALPRKLGHAAYRTLSTAVAALFTANAGLGPTLSDGEKLFDDLAHGNLGSTALTAEAWQATVQAMFKQSEYHSNKRLGIRPSFVLVPIELENTAVNLFTTTLEPGRAGNTRAIDQLTHSVITVPEWTDTTDWAAAAHPADLETVMIGYRYGRTPELWIAADPLTGSMFTNDEMRIKVRFVTTVGIGDYRGLYKHNVA
jgi:hypothetical protein